MTTSCPLLSKTPLGPKCCALGKRIFGDFIPILYGSEIRVPGRFWPVGLGLGWAQAVNQVRIRSAGAAVGFGHALKGFLDVLATARPGSFLADLTRHF
jgi:hypothetical protein